MFTFSRTYTIIGKIETSDYIRFKLNEWIDCSDSIRRDFIDTRAAYPYSSWDEGDKIDIDATKLQGNFLLNDNAAYINTWQWRDWKNKYDNLLLEKKSLETKCDDLGTKLYDKSRNYNNLERERNEWRTKFNDRNKDYEDEKEKREELQRELDRLKDERLREDRENATEKSRLVGENTRLQIENTKKDGELKNSNDRELNVSKQLEEKTNELGLVRIEKENQIALIENKLDQKQKLLENVRQSLANLRVDHEREKAEKDIEINAKESELREKENELRRKEEEIKNSQNQAGKSHEELLTEKLRSEKGNLELLATELRINLEQIHGLVKYHERLFIARKNHNQANIDVHEENISRVKQELTNQRISVVHIQEISRKCERIAELRWELEQAQQYEARQEVPTT